MSSQGFGEVSGDAALDAALGRLGSALAEVNGFDLTSLVRLGAPSSGLLAAGAEVERLRRTLAVFDRSYVCALELGDEARRRGCVSTAALLRAQLHISPSEARARVDAALACTRRAEPGGEVRPPLRPHLAAAQETGTVSTEQTDVILKALDRLPDQITEDQARVIEAMLVADAVVFTPGQLATRGRRVLERLDPDGVLRDAHWADRVRTGCLVQHKNGTGELRVHLTPAALAVWQAVVDPLGRPLPDGPAGPDPRSPGQRLHDAVHDAGQRLLAAGDLPASGGTPATVVLIVDPAEATALTSHSNRLSTGTAFQTADEAEVCTLRLDPTGVPLSMGRTVRVATRLQTLALAARDRGCSFPGCDRPPGWTQRHHVRPWHLGGTTDLDNLCLLCGYHHRAFEALGWECLMIGGRPWWRPPSWVDPERTPIRNTMFDDPAEA